MRPPIDRAVVVRLLADPNAIGDLGNDRTADRTMGADILAGGQRGAGRGRRTGFGFADTAEREAAKRRERARGDAGALQKSTPIQITAGLRPLSAGQSSADTLTFRSLDQH